MKTLKLIVVLIGLVLCLGCGADRPSQSDEADSSTPPARHLYSKHKEVLDRAKGLEELSKKRYEQIDGIEGDNK